jgi:hypothetical protein
MVVLTAQRVSTERHKHMDEIEVLKRQLSESVREVEDEREQRIKLQKFADPCHICTGTGLTPATSAPGLGSPPAASTPWPVLELSQGQHTTGHVSRNRTRVRYANRLKADLQTVSDELESTQAQSTHVQSRAKLKASHLSESLGARSHPASAPGLCAAWKPGCPEQHEGRWFVCLFAASRGLVRTARRQLAPADYEWLGRAFREPWRQPVCPRGFERHRKVRPTRERLGLRFAVLGVALSAGAAAESRLISGRQSDRVLRSTLSLSGGCVFLECDATSNVVDLRF